MRRGLAVLLTLGVAAAPLAWVPPASAAATWLPEVSASDHVVKMDNVELVVDPAGNATAVWYAALDTGTELQTASRPVGAADFGPVQTLRVGATDLVDVVGHPDGGTTVVAIARGGAGSEVILASTRASGTGTFTDLEPIEGSAGSIGDAVATVDGHGAVTVVWGIGSGTGVVLTASTRDPLTRSWSTPEPVSDELPETLLLRAGADLDGTVTVAWTQDSSEEDGHDVVAARRPRGGDFGGIDVVDDRSGDVDDLELAVNADGVAALAWSRISVPGDPIQVAVRSAGAATFGSLAPVPGSAGYDLHLAVEVDSIGQVVTAWHDVVTSDVVVVTRAGDGSFTDPVGAGATSTGVFLRTLVSELDQHDALTLVWVETTGVEDRVVANRRPSGEGFSGAVPLTQTGVRPMFFVDAETDGRGDVTVAYGFRPAGPDHAGSRVLDVTGPSLSFAASVSGSTASMTAQASDVWSAPSVVWDFGDGQTGNGTSTSHTYTASGSYTVRATASDASGNTTTEATTVSVSVAAVDRQAPSLSGAKVKPKVLPVKKAAKLVVTSSESASLKGVVQQRRTNGTWRRTATKSWSVETGANKEKLYGKRAQQRLVPGRYRVRFTATDKAGNVSATTMARFRVV